MCIDRKREKETGRDHEWNFEISNLMRQILVVYLW